MGTPLTCVFDLVPPRRPGIDDVGGGQKKNDPQDPPDSVEMPDANDDNQHQNLLVRFGGITGVAELSVHFSGGVPSIFKLSKLTTAVVSGTFTVGDTSTGVTTITWPANTFPPAVNDPKASITGATPGMISTEAITNGVIVRTLNAAGAVTDLPFNLTIF